MFLNKKEISVLEHPSHSSFQHRQDKIERLNSSKIISRNESRLLIKKSRANIFSYRPLEYWFTKFSRFDRFKHRSSVRGRTGIHLGVKISSNQRLVGVSARMQPSMYTEPHHRRNIQLQSLDSSRSFAGVCARLSSLCKVSVPCIITFSNTKLIKSCQWNGGRRYSKLFAENVPDCAANVNLL